MKNYAVIRFNVIKTMSAARASERHGLDRSRVQNRANPQNEHLNQYAFMSEYRDCNNLSDAFNKATANVKTIRKNARRFLEFICSATSFENIDLQEWVKANLQWFYKKFDKGSVISCRLDMDETTPHIHVYVVPLDIRDDEVYLNARKYINGKTELCNMQSEYAREMSQFGLIRGDHETRKHLDTELYWEIQRERERESCKGIADEVLTRG